MDAESIVSRAVAALIANDLGGHLSFFNQHVSVQVNENPPLRGTTAYRFVREMLAACGEQLVGAEVIGVDAETELGTVIRVNEEHTLPASRRRELRGQFAAFYTVRDGLIVGAKIEAFVAANRALHYP